MWRDVLEYVVAWTLVFGAAAGIYILSGSWTILLMAAVGAYAVIWWLTT